MSPGEISVLLAEGDMDTGRQKHPDEERRFTSRVTDPSTGDLSSGTAQSLGVPLASAPTMGARWLMFLQSPLGETFTERAAQGKLWSK